MATETSVREASARTQRIRISPSSRRPSRSALIEPCRVARAENAIVGGNGSTVRRFDAPPLAHRSPPIGARASRAEPPRPPTRVKSKSDERSPKTAEGGSAPSLSRARVRGRCAGKVRIGTCCPCSCGRPASHGEPPAPPPWPGVWLPQHLAIARGDSRGSPPRPMAASWPVRLAHARAAPHGPPPLPVPIASWARSRSPPDVAGRASRHRPRPREVTRPR